MRTSQTLGLIVLLTLPGFLACQRERGAPAEETGTAEEQRLVQVTGVTLGRSIGPDKRVTEEATTFAPSETIYASIETEGVASSAALGARWTYEDGQVVDETSLTIVPNGPEVTEFHISKPDGWPTGRYEVVISLDGREVDRQSFTVEAGG